MTLWIKILTSIGSIISIVFGIWHFFVPKIWNWYAYIDKSATELVLAVWVINLFFSLVLVLLGLTNLLILYKIPQEKFSLFVVLVISAVLWTVRVVIQVIYPQGSQNPFLQYILLLIFIVVWGCFALSLFLVWNKIG